MYRFMSHCKIQANGESDHLRIFFFIYVRDFYERKQKFFFQKLFSILILWACKVTLNKN